jgi:cysteine-rich repeat protein
MKTVHVFMLKIVLLSIMLVMFLFSGASIASAQKIATTTIKVSICGDGILNSGELCDDGFAGNDAGYSGSIAGRRCNATCDGYGPYCGDLTLQSLYGEECDDGNNSNGDLCDATCNNETPPINATGTPPSGGYSGGGGGGAISGFIPVNNPTRVIITGFAYANSDVSILVDGEVEGKVRANQQGKFEYTIYDATPGATTFGFWAEDSHGVRSIVYTTTFQVTQNAVTTVSGIVLPPTISADETSIRPGGTINFEGQTSPNAKVILQVLTDGSESDSAEGESEGTGDWEMEFDTSNLDVEKFHAAKAYFEVTDGGITTQSGYSQAINFYVGNEDIDTSLYTDLNVDGSVNIIDFSILLFHWGTDGGDSSPPADINQDGNVTLTDFSIMIFDGTG